MRLLGMILLATVCAGLLATASATDRHESLPPKGALAAAEATIDALESAHDWETLHRRASAFAADKELLSGRDRKTRRFAARLQQVLETSSFRTVTQLAAQADDKAADALAQFVREFPDSNATPVAGFNAFLRYQKAELLEKAISVEELALRAFQGAASRAPHRPSGPDEGKLQWPTLRDLTWGLACAYEQTASYARAAPLFEAAARSAPGDPMALGAELRAAHWYRVVDEDDRAIAAFQTYIRIYRARPPGAPELIPSDAAAQWTICEIDEARKEWDSFLTCAEQDYLGRYNRNGRKEPAWQVLNARYHEFLAFGALGLRAKQDELVKSIEESWRGLSPEDRARETTKLAIAHTQFFKLEPEFDHFKELKYRSAVSWRLAHSSDCDRIPTADHPRPLVPKYTDIVKYGNGPWAIAALVRIGTMPRIFANTLRQAPIPANLDADQREMYRGDLEDKALQIERPSIDLLLAAIGKSFELGIYNEWTLQAEATLAEIQPELVGPRRELPLRVRTAFFTAEQAAPLHAPTATLGDVLALFNAKDSAGAKAALDQLLRQEPHNAWALDLRGRVSALLGEPGEEEWEYRAAIAADPASEHAVLWLGEAFRQRGELDHAIALFTKALERDPDNLKFLVDLGESYRLAGKLDLAERTLRRVLLRHPRSVEAFRNLTAVALDENRLRLAEQVTIEARTQDQQDAAAWNNLGVLSFQRDDGDGTQAMSAFRKAVELDPGNDIALQNVGALALRYRNSGAAEEAYRAVVQREPGAWEATLDLAWALDDGAQTKAALATYEKVLALKPDLPDAVFSKGVLLCRAESWADCSETLMHWMDLKTRDPTQQGTAESYLAIARGKIRAQSRGVPLFHLP